MSCTTEVLERDPLAANLRGDQKGLPNWYTHFGSRDFARSAIPVFKDAVSQVYPQNKPLTIVGLGAGSAFYEREISRHLLSEGWRPHLVASDLQEESLRQIPDEKFPVVKLPIDSTQLPLPDESGEVIVLSRAIEHYLTTDVQSRLIAEAGRLLRPGELYVAQITSGEPVALGALSAGLRTIAGKEVAYMSLSQYRKRVSDVESHGVPVFQEIAVGYAETQTDRGALAQARRYLNGTFLQLHENRMNGDRTRFQGEVTDVMFERDNLGWEFQSGKKDRGTAIKELDTAIQSTNVYGFFRDIYVGGVTNYLKTQNIDPIAGQELPGMRIHGNTESISDIELDVAYPVVVWQKQQSKYFPS